MDPSLEAALGDALDALLAVLALQQLDEHRFRVPPDTVRTLGRVYGGQLLAQALVAAGSTVTDKPPHALHAAFVKAGAPGCSLDLLVDPVRDGRSISTRRVTVLEDDKPLLVAIVSFHDGAGEPHFTAPAPTAPSRDATPLLQQWARALPDDQREYGRHWIEQPPPLEFRIGEAPSFLGSPSTASTRSHWMRLPRRVSDDPLLHYALLAYGSDFFLMDMVFRAHPDAAGPGKSNGLSLDHAIWFHRPVRFDEWHLHTQEAVAVVGDRGLARGAIHDADGNLVATVMQEVLVLPLPTR
jgi:acyl-CoA thioesterase-2